MRRETETTLNRAILVAVNRVPDVRVVRNNQGMSPCACKACVPGLCPSCAKRLTRPIRFGISEGSPDLVGIMTIAGCALAFGLEVKVAARRNQHKERLRKQEAWRTVAGRKGMLCEVVTSVAEALDAVARMRATYLERIARSISSGHAGARSSPAG